VYISNGGLDALGDWIEARGDRPGPLFPRLRRLPAGAYEVTSDRLTTGGVRDLVNRRAVAAGVEDEVRPHDFRRSVASELLDAGIDLATVARLLGHPNVATTQRYDRRPEAALASAVSKIRFPYRRARSFDAVLLRLEEAPGVLHHGVERRREARRCVAAVDLHRRARRPSQRRGDPGWQAGLVL
jgi:hypothetical protein